MVPFRAGDEVRWHTCAEGWRFGRVLAFLHNQLGNGCHAVVIDVGHGTTITRSALGVELCGKWPE